MAFNHNSKQALMRKYVASLAIMQKCNGNIKFRDQIWRGKNI